MTHTPGPWTWMNYPDGRKLLAAPARAVVHCPDAPMTCDPADARLIAAAPDLLAALKRLTEAEVYVDNGYCQGYWPNEHLEDCEGAQALAAIAKAEGRS